MEEDERANQRWTSVLNSCGREITWGLVSGLCLPLLTERRRWRSSFLLFCLRCGGENCFGGAACHDRQEVTPVRSQAQIERRHAAELESTCRDRGARMPALPTTRPDKERRARIQRLGRWLISTRTTHAATHASRRIGLVQGPTEIEFRLEVDCQCQKVCRQV